MTNLDLAHGFLKQAQAGLGTITRAIEDVNYAYAVRSAQESVELSLKAALLSVGIDPHKWHDVGTILRDNKHKFVDLTGEEIDRLALISAKLRGDRERSMDGDESLGLPPDRLYSQYDAKTTQE